MTLQEWTKTTGIAPDHPHRHPEATAVIVPITTPRTHRINLWHLSDYHVSSVSGPVVWLVPKIHSSFAQQIAAWEADQARQADNIAQTQCAALLGDLDHPNDAHNL